jgi:F0F1-type ATP synthase membrane subunit b/b'
MTEEEYQQKLEKLPPAEKALVLEFRAKCRAAVAKYKREAEQIAQEALRKISPDQEHG